jgi:hypothetical protein
MQIRQSKIILDSLQIKSVKKAKLLAKALAVIEEECGIHEVKIELKDVFICPWINLEALDKTPMEELLREIIL